jgi:hypothetical protein
LYLVIYLLFYYFFISGRYWAESVSYNSNYTGDSMSEAHLAEPTNHYGTAWHRKTMPMGEDFYHARI